MRVGHSLGKDRIRSFSHSTQAKLADKLTMGRQLGSLFPSYGVRPVRSQEPTATSHTIKILCIPTRPPFTRVKPGVKCG